MQTADVEIGFNKQFAADINGVHTEFVFHSFSNKWFLLITQLGNAPSIYNVMFDIKRTNCTLPYLHGPVNHPEFHVSVPVTMQCCLGEDTDETRSGIQFLINNTALANCPTGLVIGLGLEKVDGVNLRAVARILEAVIRR